MMKLTTAFLATIALCSPALAQSECSPFYASVSGGVSFLQDTNSGVANLGYDSGLGINGALGWYEKRIRIEAEFSKLNMDVDNVTGINVATGNVDIDAWMLSGYFDLPLTSQINAYFGGGLGVARISANSLADGAGGFINATSEMGTAFQVRAGGSKDITDRAEIFGGYRFLATEGIAIADNNLNVNGIFEDELVTHGLELGLRLKF